MKKILLFSVVLACCGCVAQNLFDKQQNANTIMLLDDISDKAPSEKIKGSSYVNEAFFPAMISDYKDVVLVRYNAEKDEVEVQNSSTKAVFILRKDERFGKITSQNAAYTLKLFHYAEGGKPIYGYLAEVFSENGLSLLRREKIRFQAERQPKSSYDVYAPAQRIRVKDSYYLQLRSGAIVEMPNGKKALQELFSQQKEQIADFLKTNDLSFKEEKDLITLARFLSAF